LIGCRRFLASLQPQHARDAKALDLLEYCRQILMTSAGMTWLLTNVNRLHRFAVCARWPRSAAADQMGNGIGYDAGEPTGFEQP